MVQYESYLLHISLAAGSCYWLQVIYYFWRLLWESPFWVCISHLMSAFAISCLFSEVKVALRTAWWFIARFRLHWFLPATVYVKPLTTPKCCFSPIPVVFQSILWKQRFLRAITGTISPQTGQFTLCCNDWTTSLVKCWYRRGIAHSSGKLQRVPRLFLDSFGWIPSPCSRCSLQRHNTDCHQLWLGPSTIGHSMGFVMLIQTTLTHESFRA